MSNYAYGANGGNYSTTAYGAQGGVDGGGFLGGSQAGSQESPGGSKTAHAKDSLRPVTIKQILDAHQPHPDSEFKIDGVEVSQITFVGQVHSVTSQATNNTYKLDDGTGLIDVKQWVDSDQDSESRTPLPQENDYLRVFGRLKAFNNKRHVGAHVIRPIADFMEVQYHLLEATAVHLYFTRGPPPSAGGIKTEASNGLFVDSYGGGPVAAPGGTKLGPGASAVAKKVFNLLLSESQNEGLHISLISSKLGLPVTEVLKAGEEMLGNGAIFTTVDDETWAVLEY